MEQVYFRVHVRAHGYITRFVPERLRRFTEMALLGSTLLLFSLLIVLHVSHISPFDGGCLKGLLPPDSPTYDVLQIKVSPPKDNELVQAMSHIMQYMKLRLTDRSSTVQSTAVSSIGKSSPHAPFLNRLFGTGSGEIDEAESACIPYASEGISPFGCGGERSQVFQFALEKGWLLINPEERARHRVVERTVEISGNLYDECMSPLINNLSVRKNGKVDATNDTLENISRDIMSLLLRGILQTFLGYETIIVHSLIALYGGRGYLAIEGAASGELLDLGTAAEYTIVASAGGSETGRNAWFGRRAGMGEEEVEDRTNIAAYDTSRIGKLIGYKLGVILTALFLFFVTTPLVNFTLRETQERMLKFTILLHHHVRHQQSYFALIAAHMVDSLVYIPIMVGMVFFLFQFFDDQLLAFIVLSVVWICEVYSAISVRTPQSIRFFPRFFLLYFLAFHIYVFSYPFGGFSHLAVLALFLLPMLHVMTLCWNRFEAPALNEQTVTALHPRGISIQPIPQRATPSSTLTAPINPNTAANTAFSAARSNDNLENDGGAPLSGIATVLSSDGAFSTLN